MATRNALLLAALTLPLAPIFACVGDDTATPSVTADGGVDAATDSATIDGEAPKVPVLDPTKGSFAPARESVMAMLALGTRGELTFPNRFFPARDPLFIASAISEVRRAAATTDCLATQYGCPASTGATQLVDEYQANKASLATALKKVQAVQHAWGRIALSASLLAVLDVLEQAKAIDAADVAALTPAAAKLASAFAVPATTPSGIYPELSPNAALYGLAFQQIRPAPAPSAAHLAAANELIGAVFGRLAIGPKPEDPLAIGPKPEDPLSALAARLSKGLGAQGITQGIIVQGSEAAQAFESLAYFITVGAAADPSSVDGYIQAIDDLLPKVAAATAGDADWAKYAGAADRLASTFDAASGALASATLIASVTATAKPVPAGLEDDPNVLQHAATMSLLRDNAATLLAEPPVLRIATSAPTQKPIGERRAPIVMPAGVDVPLATRPSVATVETVGLYAPSKATPIILSWDQSTSSTELDHVDLRIENLTTSTVVFHKIYRRALDGSIATKTMVPVDPAWLSPGVVNNLQVRGTAVDRSGRSSGIICASLAMKDGAASSGAPSGAGLCFPRALDLGEGPLTLPPAGADVVIGKYLGTPFRPTVHYASANVRIQNDTATPRRLRSLFSPDYSEIPPGIDLATRKDSTTPAGLAPLDTGVIAAGSFVDLAIPAAAPSGYTFTLFDADNGPSYHLQITTGALLPPKYW